MALGDVLDRITILRIKAWKCQGDVRERLLGELEELIDRGEDSGYGSLPEEDDLEAVNRLLWEVEDALRLHEQREDFGDEFVQLARSVYRLNDRRAALKRAVSLKLESGLLEEKVHP
jgi:hypothetical protein